MDTVVTIRQANDSDLSAVLEVENMSFDSDKFSKRQFSYLIKKANGKLFVAEYENKIAGYISLLCRKHSTAVRIYGIAVHPDVRGKKIAQQLIATARSFAADNGFTSISLEVKVNNTAAIQLYQKNGFATTSVKPSYYADGADAYCMKLSFN